MRADTLVLASQSPRRRDILRQLGVLFEVRPTHIEEIPEAGELPASYVVRLARAKAQHCYDALAQPGRPVLAADTVVVCDDQLLEKPAGRDQALAMYRHLSGRTHQVMTALCLTDGARCAVEVSVTEVQFRPLSQALMVRYWHTGEGLDKAGGYGIQGLGAALVQSISGSYTGVVGLPVEKLIPLLEQFDLPYWCIEDDHE